MKKKNDNKWTKSEEKKHDEDWEKIATFIESLGYELKGSSVEKNAQVGSKIFKFYWEFYFHTKD
jgi:hypothetical protein